MDENTRLSDRHHNPIFKLYAVPRSDKTTSPSPGMSLRHCLHSHWPEIRQAPNGKGGPNVLQGWPPRESGRRNRHTTPQRKARCRHGIEGKGSLRGDIASRLPTVSPRLGPCWACVKPRRTSARALVVTIFIFIMAGRSPMIPCPLLGCQACRHTPSSRRRPSVSSLLVIIARTAGWP